jgi:ABC-2 type transport system ATP-binding protein
VDENIVLQIKNIFFSYSNATVLKDITFSGKKGELIVLAGPNGSGKTTLIKLIFDLLERQKGEILVNGEDNRKMQVKNRILYLPSDNILPEFLTGDEYVRFICKLYEVKLDEELYKQLTIYYVIEDHIDEMIENYSHGMVKKIQLITAFLIKADITIIDETLNGIDIKAKEVSKVLLKKLSRKNKLVIMCTHDLELAELVGDRAILIYNGYICSEVDLIDNKGKISLTELFKDMIGFEESNYEI